LATVGDWRISLEVCPSINGTTSFLLFLLHNLANERIIALPWLEKEDCLFDELKLDELGRIIKFAYII